MSREFATRVFIAARTGDASAADQLTPLLYDELRLLAGKYIDEERPGHTLQATALVNEAYLRLIDVSSVKENDKQHFMALAAKTMRRVLVDHYRRRSATKRGGNRERVTLSTELAEGESKSIDVVHVDELLSKLAMTDERAARVVELKFFGGLTTPQIAETLNVSPRTVESDWYYARGWLYRELSRA